MNVRQNPFFQVSTLPWQAPPFDQIQEADFLPALLAGIEEKRKEVQAIAQNPEAPTFANTFEALERSGQLLERVNLVFGAMTSANTSDYLQQVDEEIAPQLTALNDEIVLNSALFARLDAVYQQRETLALDPESLRLVEVTWQHYQLRAPVWRKRPNSGSRRSTSRRHASARALPISCWPRPKRAGWWCSRPRRWRA